MVQQLERLWFYRMRRRKRDVFVHYSAIEAGGYRVLNEGDVVEFEIEEGPKARKLLM